MQPQAFARRAVALLLGAVLLLMSACTTSPEEGSSAESGTSAEGLGTQATGRYMEEQLPLPGGINYMMMLEEDADGDLWLFASQATGETGSPWGLWRSVDAGESWTPQQPGWLEELAMMSIQMVTLAPEGGFYVYYTVPEVVEDLDGVVPEDGESDELPEEEADGVAMTFTEESYEDWLADYVPPEAHLVHVQDSMVTELDYGLPTTDYGYSGDSILAAGNGDLLHLLGYSMQQLDGETGQVRYTYEPRVYMGPGYISAAHGRLALFEESSIAFFDLESGQRLGEVSVSADVERVGEGQMVVFSDYIGNQALAFDPQDPDAVYFALDSGLYRGVMDSPLVERLIDGELTSLNMPAYNIGRLIVRADGRFLVYCGGSDNLLRYHFDPDVPTVPTTELKVYSLEENRSVRQFMGMFQLRNPDVKVSYTVGMPQGSAITGADALRTLSTELLGGGGPDVLILDGLPVESYIRQGALADLDGLYGTLSGALLENVAASYRQEDGGIYAIPARFTVPVMMAPAEAVSGIGSMADLVAWAEAQQRFNLSNSSAGTLMDYLYPLLASDWFDREGVLDRDAFGRSLEQMRRLEETVDKNESLEADSGNILFDAVFYASGNLSMILGRVHSLSDLENYYSAQKVREGALVPLPDSSGQQVFYPGTVMGVNAASAQQDLALEFVTMALGEEAQSVDVGDGLPVLRKVLLAQTESPYDENEGGYYGYTVGFAMAANEEDPEGDEEMFTGQLSVEWPTQDYFDEFLALLEGLEPCTVDDVVRQIALEEAEGYFTGFLSLDQAVSGLVQKVELYLSERR